MKDARMFLVFWILNSIVLYFTPFILVGLVAVGNARLSHFLASIVSGFILATALTLVMPVFSSFKIKLKAEWQWALVFLFVNVLTIWVIARYADLTGVEIVNAWVAVMLGVLLNILQWVGWKLIGVKL